MCRTSAACRRLTGATAGAGFEAGTSFATPQVAAVAEYVWTLEPRLSAQQLAQLLRDTAQRQLAVLSADSGCDQLSAPAPAIDAYGALLSLDTAQLPLPGSDQPVRTALLDSAAVEPPLRQGGRGILGSRTVDH